MSELRQDPISGQWVIIAPERAGRPDDFSRRTATRPSGPCPFCAGHEHLTSTPLWELPASAAASSKGPNATHWRIRVLANKFPALADNTTMAMDGAADAPQAISAAAGRHEVVVESPEHVQSVTDLSPQQMADVILVYRDRLAELKRDPRLICGLVFKNVGPGGGATLEHVHSQIVALPAVPERLRAELAGAAEWQARHGRCAFCALVDRELADGTRLVATSESFVAVAPWASRMAYETWILPRQHASHFETFSDSMSAELAGMLQQVVGGIEHFCEGGAYNYLIHTAPFDRPSGDHYHWHIEVIPRVTRLAGFELGTGWYINAVLPEIAAAKLRNFIAAAEERRSSTASLPIR